MSSYTLFHLSSGVVNITEPLQFSLQSAPTADPPVFTLTCISTGGPATTITWTRDGVVATGITSQTVVDQQTATYHNTLTVTGKLPGNYQCNVTNARTMQPATASLTVAGELKVLLLITIILHHITLHSIAGSKPHLLLCCLQ